MPKPLPSLQYLNSCLRYEPSEGFLYWNRRPDSHFATQRAASAWNSTHSGNHAFTAVSKQGYHVGAIDCGIYLAHRVIWKVCHGTDPPEQIDHINGVRTDNRIENLRCVTNLQNSRNAKKGKSNTSGVTGVYLEKSTGVWYAQIKVDGKSLHLGRFEEFNDAVIARQQAEEKHNFGPNHGA